MIESDWQVPYDPKDATNRQLADDWRLFIAAIANLEAGKNEPYTEKGIFLWAVQCIKEIVTRVMHGKMRFQISKSKSESYEKLWQHVVKSLTKEEAQALQPAAADSVDLPAIYLVSPHAELIVAGKKTMVIKARDFSACCDQELLFCSAGLCFGTLKLKKPEKISLEKLEELYPLHRITHEEREAWWPKAEVLYASEVYDIITWDVPRRVEIPQGVQTFARSVKFIDAAANEEQLAPVNPSGVEIGEELTLERSAQVHPLLLPHEAGKILKRKLKGKKLNGLEFDPEAQVFEVKVKEGQSLITELAILPMTTENDVWILGMQVMKP
jgi:hypothetical protein